MSKLLLILIFSFIFFIAAQRRQIQVQIDPFEELPPEIQEMILMELFLGAPPLTSENCSTIEVFTPETCVAEAITCASEQHTPQCVASEIWVANEATDEIVVLDGETFQTITTISGIGSRPREIIFDKAGEYAFVTTYGTGSLDIIRTSDYQVIQRIKTGDGAYHAMISPDETRIWVVNVNEHTITEIMIDTEAEMFKLSKVIPIRKLESQLDALEFPEVLPKCVQFSPNGELAYITLVGGGMVVIDVETEELVKSYGKSIITGESCYPTISPDGNDIFLASGTPEGGNFYVFDGNSTAFKHKQDADGENSYSLAFSRDSRSFWIVNRDANTISIFDTFTKEFVTRVPIVGHRPALIAMSEDGNYAFITLTGEDEYSMPGVAVVNTFSFILERVVAVPGSPHGIATRCIERNPNRIITTCKGYHKHCIRRRNVEVDYDVCY